MLDLREVYRKVSSSVHDFTDEHLRNLHAIVGLYRGSNEPLKKALTAYKHNRDEFLQAAQTLADQIIPIIDKKELRYIVLYDSTLKTEKREFNNKIKHYLSDLKEKIKGKERSVANDLKKKVSELEDLQHNFNEAIDQAIYFHKEYTWLSSRFPEGKYVYVPGLCKIVSRKEIADNDYSLTPGRYVGVAPSVDEDFDYESRMSEIRLELLELNDGANLIFKQIELNLSELGL